jgi:tetratricopeptide (TPR) repeat protein
MSAYNKHGILIVLVLALAVAGCGKTMIIPALGMDSPEYRYRKGVTYLNNGQIKDAMKSFQRALDLRSRSALGHVGMIRLYSTQRDKNWLRDAEKNFRSGEKRDPESPRLHYFMGIAYKLALEYNKATDMFETVLDIDQEYTREADAELALIRKIRMAEPVTPLARKVSILDTIDRAEISTLFDQELELEKLLSRRGDKSSGAEFKVPKEPSGEVQAGKDSITETVTDIEDHVLKPSIDRVLKYHIRGLEAGPDNAFHPDKPVTRSEFAIMLEDILIKASGDEKLATKFLTTPSPFSDISNDQYFFHPAMTAASRGFIEADKTTGEFKPGDPISGVDVLLAIKEFKKQLKFESY